MTSAANGVPAKVGDQAPVVPANNAQLPGTANASKLFVETLGSPSSPGAERPSWAEMLSAAKAARSMSVDSNSPSTKTPSPKESPMMSPLGAISLDASPNKADEPSFHYIVNVPVHNRDAAFVRANVNAAMECCDALQQADPRRVFSVVFGLNKKADQENTDETLAQAALLFETEFQETWGGPLIRPHLQAVGLPYGVSSLTLQYLGCRGNIRPPYIAGFTWRPLNGRNQQGPNFVDFRNSLYYHGKTQQAIQAAVHSAQSHKGPAQVKLLALDPDTQILPQQLSRLEKRWQEEGAPLVTSGSYRFDFGQTPVSLAQDPNNLSWEGFLVNCENEVDCAGKQAFAQRRFEVSVPYKKIEPKMLDQFESAKQDEELRKLARRNLVALSTCKDPRGKAALVLKPKYEDLLRNLKLKKEILEDKTEYKNKQEQLDLVEKNIKLLKDEIVRYEKDVKGDRLTALTGRHTILGEECLYPTEPALFVTLFDRTARNASINLWETTCRFNPAVNKEKPIAIWGNREGACEGQNIVLQIKRLMRRTPHQGMTYKLVEFPWVFTTKTPPRCLQFEPGLMAPLPKTLEALLAKPDAIDKAVSEIFRTISQSSLMQFWPKQRCGFIKGQPVGNTDALCSPIPCHLRVDAAAQMLKDLQRFHEDQVRAGLALVKKKIAELEATQGKR